MVVVVVIYLNNKQKKNNKKAVYYLPTVSRLMSLNLTHHNYSCIRAEYRVLSQRVMWRSEDTKSSIADRRRSEN